MRINFFALFIPPKKKQKQQRLFIYGKNYKIQ